jgi:acetyl/propionyl-CoA carboxylase alpha subunit/acetyl-CoA carboxylase carboxyltransferase component
MALARPFRRLAIVNRGEAAMRVIHAVRELNEDRDEQIELIALYTEPERHAMFVRHADEAFCIGPASVLDDQGRRRNGYLDYRALERALTAVRADAAWPGWGLVAEHPEFADLCERLGVVFVGPDGPAMRRLGDKIEAKLLAERAGVPVAPWSGGAVADVPDADRLAEEIGFPLMIKAAAGGGGRGIRRVDEAGALAAAFEHARIEALESFGDATVLLERLITPARHVEVQVIADGAGAAWALGVRDCTYQRRNQKVIEESSSSVLSAEQELELEAAATRLALLAGYRNAGTVEFLYEPEERRFSFMEVNARLQVEHPVTEMVTGCDLVKLQLHIAAGGRLEGEPPRPSGHAVEARLNAEDPAMDFAPMPGRVEILSLPAGPGLRVDAGIAAGDAIPAEFDSMIAKIIAWGPSRADAIARLRRALRQTTAVLQDGTTNQSFLLALLGRSELLSGDVDTTWLDRLHISGELEPARNADVALLQAAIELADAELAADRARFYAFARRGRPQTDAKLTRVIDVRHRGQSYRFRVSQVSPRRYRLAVDAATVEADVEHLSSHERRISFAGRSHRTLISGQGAELLVEVDGVPHRIARDEGGVVRSHAPAVVVAIKVTAGDEVAGGEVVAVLESMKMETSIVAPFAGHVRQVMVAPNVQVGPNTPLVQIEPSDGLAAREVSERAVFDRYDTVESLAPERCVANLERLQWLILGYDIGADDVRAIIEDLHGACADIACSPLLIPGEHRLLDLFADLRALSRPQHGVADPDGDLLRSPQEYLHAFLRSLDAEAEGLPPRFVSLLSRALVHYGIETLERTPRLEDASYRIFISQQRTEAARAAVLALLDRRLEQAEELIGNVGVEFREVLDRLGAAMEGREAELAERAREARYRFFDEPLITAAREAVYDEMNEHLRALAEDPERPDRADVVRALTDCPRALAPLLSRRMTDASPGEQRVLLEVITRRYYRVRDVGEFSDALVDRVPFAITHYEREGRRHHLATAFVELDELPAAVGALASHAASVPDGEVLVADFYAKHAGMPPPPDELASELRRTLERAQPRCARAVVGIAEPGRGYGMSAVDLFTLYRDRDGGFFEDQNLRGLHPEMAERIQLWRLAEFACTRLPSAEDVYVFHGVARANSKDERLFAFAEVRDLSAVRDEDGQVLALPELERMLQEALHAVRHFQSRRPPRERLLWNRIQLYAWPTIEIDPQEVRPIMARYARGAGALGIEMVVVLGRLLEADGVVRERELRFSSPSDRGVVAEIHDSATLPIEPLDEAARRIVQARRRGTVHPLELVKILTHDQDASARELPRGEFLEHDLAPDGCLARVDRSPALNDAGVVVGTVRNFTPRYPEGMLRVAVLGDPTRALGSLAEPECQRIVAALDLAEELDVPLEWFAVSAGAKIAMDSGTENMDWIAAVLRRIVEFTQRGGEINVVVCGVNVGAQPYWNAEATMLMHTRGILVMTPESTMVLTGKQALDYSGGVSAEDNFGIGGYERIMGPNGEAQFWAPDLDSACHLLLDYYEHAYVAPGEGFPRRAHTSDPIERDVCDSPHAMAGSGLATVGAIFSDAANPERKQPFDIRSVMQATIDHDHRPLERWAGAHDAEATVVWEAHLGGWPVALLGIESKPLERYGAIPADGPEQWTSGTLFPRGAKKLARAINAAAGRRPVVVLANLAGFDGSPESMRRWQLEFGAEIGRAVVNFDGPLVFCVISRYHGGAFVVFSQRLNEQLETVAVEGARASVIGGAPAAAVVFVREVEAAARGDPELVKMRERIAAASGIERQRLRAEEEALWKRLRSEKIGELAARFDAIHSVERAVQMGSVSRIIAPSALRPFLIHALERGIARVTSHLTVHA